MTNAIRHRGFEDDEELTDDADLEIGSSCRVDVSAADMLVKRPVNVPCNSLRRMAQCCVLSGICSGFGWDAKIPVRAFLRDAGREENRWEARVIVPISSPV